MAENGIGVTAITCHLDAGGFLPEAEKRRGALRGPAPAHCLDHGLFHQSGDKHRRIALAAQLRGNVLSNQLARRSKVIPAELAIPPKDGSASG